MIWDLYRAGVDALTHSGHGDYTDEPPSYPPYTPVHRCDTLEPEDVQHLEALGFEQVVLARELNMEQIRRIRAVTTCPPRGLHPWSSMCLLQRAVLPLSSSDRAIGQSWRMLPAVSPTLRPH